MTHVSWSFSWIILKELQTHKLPYDGSFNEWTWLLNKHQVSVMDYLIKYNSLKGSSDATCSFTSCLNWNVCWQCIHNHSIIIKIFLISLNHFPFLISSYSQMPVCVTSHRPRPSHDCWLTLAFYFRPALSELSSVLQCFDAGAVVDKNGS